MASPNWDAACDFNGNGTVDISDWTAFVARFGEAKEETPAPAAVVVATPNIGLLVLIAIVLLAFMDAPKKRRK